MQSLKTPRILVAACAAANLAITVPGCTKHNNDVQTLAPQASLKPAQSAAKDADSALTSRAQLKSAQPAARDTDSALLNKWEDCIEIFEKPNPMKDPGGQGRDLLGLGFIPKGHEKGPNRNDFFVRVDRFDLTSVVTSDGLPITDVQIQGNALVGKLVRDGVTITIEGQAWLHAVFSGLFRCPKKPQTEFPIKARVARFPSQLSADADASDGHLAGAWLYPLELQVVSEWIPACHEPNDLAIPVAGYWDRRSNYQPGDAFSFGCKSAGAYKCLERGYSSNRVVQSEQPELFEACTRMMRADYCGNGVSFTRKGSLISAWDNRPSVTAPPDTATFRFEAAWTSSGALCYGDKTRWPVANMMLSESPEKLQYMICAAALKNHTGIPKCQNQSEAESLGTGRPLIFNQSCTTHPDLCEGEQEPKTASDMALWRRR